MHVDWLTLTASTLAVTPLCCNAIANCSISYIRKIWDEITLEEKFVLNWAKRLDQIVLTWSCFLGFINHGENSYFENPKWHHTKVSTKYTNKNCTFSALSNTNYKILSNVVQIQVTEMLSISYDMHVLLHVTVCACETEAEDIIQRNSQYGL